MIDASALNMTVWAVLITCAIAVGATGMIILGTWLHYRGEVARGLRAIEEHAAVAARRPVGALAEQ